MNVDELLITCEHGGNAVPAGYRSLFEGRDALLASHRGWDPGSLSLGRHLAKALQAPLVAARTTRLLIDLNRPLGHPRLFSELTRRLSPRERRSIEARYHTPHWARIRSHIGAAITRGHRILHVSCHSYTPVWHGADRPVDLGLLYDPSRAREKELCGRWLATIRHTTSELRARANEPYRGNAPGLTTSMRKEFGASRYLGIEVEISQRYTESSSPEWRWIRATLVSLLRAAVVTGTPSS